MAYPIKDFRDAGEYPEHLDISAWRWEFLRRSSDYQDFYEAHKDQFPPPYTGQFGILGLYDPRYDRSHEAFSDGGHLVGLPTFEDVRRWQESPDYTHERALYSVLSGISRFQTDSMSLAVLDRALPLDLQLEALKRNIELRCEIDGTVPVLKTNRRQEWPIYLRILDAIAEGLEAKEIAPLLYPGQEDLYPDFKVRKKILLSLKRAEHLCKTFARKAFDTEKK